jgi:hypothetical protein
MREIVIDTETAVVDPLDGHRVVEEVSRPQRTTKASEQRSKAHHKL